MTDGDDDLRGLRSRLGELSTVQQRFEESRVGKMVISGLLVVAFLVCVAWNLPDSPIKRVVQPALAPVAVPTGLDQGWAMYAPDPSKRADMIEVQVKMADGETKTWTTQPGQPGIGWWDRWLKVRYYAVLDANLRPQLARWVVRQVTGPDEQAVAVEIILRTETLQAPADREGESGTRRPTATKIIYREQLAGTR
ncbi:hypothetical protein MGALJ_33930 [Mycobacterium gallinarum]|uniref:Uncharacterized protein n=1 Tax=Mycobacterium gallinarum TaxID=39689 RepID=A0A9W4B4F4_9MYCO|nr:hypothetical protein [Mycobacterium gallinarum]BBY93724.1 hypothetical protein MGALJ_33930 [Mycobacterium gallinarum]